jgi:multidrug efflux pump subunit AcrB
MPRWAIQNPHLIAVIAALVGILGILSAWSIPVDILPAFETPSVQVLTYYQGMPAASVERTITNRLERWLNQAPGVNRMESRSLSGVSVIRVMFRDGTNPNAALTMGNALASSALPTLPPNTLPPVVLPFDPTATVPLGLLVVKNDNLDEAGIKDLARIDLRNKLGAIPGVVSPVVVGGKDRTILVYLDHDKLDTRRLAPTDVVKALQDGNLISSPGNAYFGDRQMALEVNSMVERVQELDSLPLKLPSGAVIQLGDVAHAEDTASIQTSRVRVDGKQQVYVPVYRQGGASSLAVAGSVKSSIPGMEESLEKGTTLDWVMDQSEGVAKSIESLMEEGALGAVLVAVMILLFLGSLKMTGIALLLLPLSALFTILGLFITGNTINSMTLGGLFLAIGPLVDNAIVVLENTQRHLGMGKGSTEAATDAANELSLPLLVATLAMMVVLAPVAFTPGVAGFLYRPLALAVSLALGGSLVLCFTMVPLLASKWLGGGHGGGHGVMAAIHHGVESFLDGLTNAYLAVLDFLKARKFLASIALLVASLSSLLLLPATGKEFFPGSDTGQIVMTVQAPSDSRLDGTEKRVAKIEELVRNTIPAEDIRLIVSELGLTTDWSAAYTENSGQMDAIIRIQLSDERTSTTAELTREIRDAMASSPELSDIKASFNTGGIIMAALNFGASSPIEVAISSGSVEKSMAAARRVERLIRKVPGAVDVQVRHRDDLPVLRVNVRRQKAAEVGLSPRDVASQLVAAMNSSASLQRNFWIDAKSGNQYFVAVQYPENSERTIQDILAIKATGTSSSSAVTLGTLADIDLAASPVELRHLQMTRMVSISVNVDGRDLGAVASDILPIIQSESNESGLRIRLLGEYGRMVETFASLGAGLTLALAFVYLLMVPLLRDFVTPLVILVGMIPGTAGVLITLWLTSTPINIQSIMGVVFLAGIVVSQGVLLVDAANRNREAGMDPWQAARGAGSIRLRAILMTFLATVLDLLPLALGLSRGSETLLPLARAVIGGLVMATALSLFAVPILLSVVTKNKMEPGGNHENR